MNLRAALEAVYAAFADQARPTYIIHESYELRPEEVHQLLNLPLRELSPELMRSYKFEAVTCVGTWDDFRYFFPRLLETLTLTPEDPDCWEQLEDMAWRLRYAREKEYSITTAQAESLRQYALAWWQAFLEAGPTLLPAEFILSWETLQTFGTARAELLRLWREHPRGAEHLAYGIVCPPAEWPGSEIVAWLEAALSADPDGDAAQLIREALTSVRK